MFNVIHVAKFVAPVVRETVIFSLREFQRRLKESSIYRNESNWLTVGRMKLVILIRKEIDKDEFFWYLEPPAIVASLAEI